MEEIFVGNDLKIYHKDQPWNYYQFKRDAGPNDKWANWISK